MNIKTILAITDLSLQENHALRRAARLARAHRAMLRLAYASQEGIAAWRHPAARLAETARELEGHFGLRVDTAPVQTGKLEEVVAGGQLADLVVVPHRRERSTAAFFRGQPVARLLRRVEVPVLVARRAVDRDWRRVLAGVDFSAESNAVARYAALVQKQTELELFHAIGLRDETRLRSAEAPEHAVAAFRKGRLASVQRKLDDLSRTLHGGGQRFGHAVGHGDAGNQLVMRQRQAQADLVVVGKQRSGCWEDFLRSSVAHKVLSWSSSDVLIVPYDYVRRDALSEARRALAMASGDPAPPRLTA